MTRGRGLILIIALATPALGAGSLASAAASAAAAHHRTCRVPRLEGLSVSAGRKRAAKAHCRLRLRGARVQQARVQKIVRQSVRRGGRARVVTVWVSPRCEGPEHEPVFTPGPTELVSGLFEGGGPEKEDEPARCASPAPGGTIAVINRTGEEIASRTVARGQLARIPLPPGEYTIDGTFPIASSTGPTTTVHQPVTIPPGETVRQDVTFGGP
jgi:hypothetical protein